MVCHIPTSAGRYCSWETMEVLDTFPLVNAILLAQHAMDQEIKALEEA